MKDFCPLEFQKIHEPDKDWQCLDGEPCNVHHCVFCVQNKYCLPKLSPQCQKLYDRLKLSPITNAQIRDELQLLEYRRRFKDLRDKYGIQTTKRPLGNGLYEYKLAG
jgi:hypothetical protein